MPGLSLISRSRRPTNAARSRVSGRFTTVTGAGIKPSVCSMGDNHDNALAETINGLSKAEIIHRHGPGHSFQTVECVALEWEDWLDNRRLIAPIGNMMPA